MERLRLPASAKCCAEHAKALRRLGGVAAEKVRRAEAGRCGQAAARRR